MHAVVDSINPMTADGHLYVAYRGYANLPPPLMPCFCRWSRLIYCRRGGGNIKYRMGKFGELGVAVNLRTHGTYGTVLVDFFNNY